MADQNPDAARFQNSWQKIIGKAPLPQAVQELLDAPQDGAQFAKSRWLKYLSTERSPEPVQRVLQTAADFRFRVPDDGTLWSLMSFYTPRSPEMAVAYITDHAHEFFWRYQRMESVETFFVSDGNVGLALTYPEKMSPTTAIRQVFDYYQGDLPGVALITLALVICPHLPKRGKNIVFSLGMTGMLGQLYAQDMVPYQVGPAVSTADIKAAVVSRLDSDVLAQSELAHLASHNIYNPADILRYLLCLGEMLWDTADQRRYRDTWLDIAWFAELEILARSYWVFTRRENSDIPWWEVVELSTATPATQRFLTRRPLLDAAQLDRDQLARYNAQMELLLATAAAMLRAATPPHYQPPVGAPLYVLLPSAHPLRVALAIVQLGIVADERGLWCVPLTATQRLGAFHWQPTSPNSSGWLQIISPTYADLLHATLAALWHDLCVVGETVLVTERPRTQPPAIDSGPHLTRAERRRQARQLPRRKIVRESGPATERVVDWEAVASPRAAARIHAVCGHPRRLQDGQHASAMALAFAGDFGLIVPDGYTFVRPFVRGAGVSAGEAPEPTPVKAKGLLTLSLLLQKENQ